MPPFYINSTDHYHNCYICQVIMPRMPAIHTYTLLDSILDSSSSGVSLPLLSPTLPPTMSTHTHWVFIWLVWSVVSSIYNTTTTLSYQHEGCNPTKKWWDLYYFPPIPLWDWQPLAVLVVLVPYRDTKELYSYIISLHHTPDTCEYCHNGTHPAPGTPAQQVPECQHTM